MGQTGRNERLDAADPTPAAPLSETSPSAPPRAAAPSIGDRAARGFTIYFTQFFASKVVSLASQIVLSWLLVRKDYGYLGLAMAVATFTGLVQQAGVRDILVRRGKRYNRWANTAFWLSACSGLAGALLMLIAAPLAAYIYREQTLMYLIALLALGGMITSLGSVPEAKLHIDLRFRAIATLNFSSTTAGLALAVVLAVMGFGAYSYVLPHPITAAGRLAAAWWMTRPPVRLQIRPRRMRYLLSDSGLLVLNSVFVSILWQGDYLILGLLYPEDLVGLYVWAFGLSLQSIYMLAESMSGVLFPSLSKLADDPARQRDAFLRAARVLALVGIPACFAQAVLAAPGVHLVFNPRWFEAVPLVQVLSIGMSVYVVGSASFAALKAQGRFKRLLMINSLCSVSFVMLVTCGAWARGPLGAAVAVCINLCILTASALTSMLGEHAWRDLPRIFVIPLLLSAAASAAAWGVVAWLPRQTKPQWLLVALVSATVLAVVYVPLARALAPEPWKELLARMRQMRPRRAIAP